MRAIKWTALAGFVVLSMLLFIWACSTGKDTTTTTRVPFAGDDDDDMNFPIGDDDTIGDDTSSDDTASDDTVGDDTAGDDTAGDDTVGDDTADDDTADDDTSDDDTAIEVHCDPVEGKAVALCNLTKTDFAPWSNASDAWTVSFEFDFEGTITAGNTLKIGTTGEVFSTNLLDSYVGVDSRGHLAKQVEVPHGLREGNTDLPMIVWMSEDTSDLSEHVSNDLTFSVHLQAISKK